MTGKAIIRLAVNGGLLALLLGVNAGFAEPEGAVIDSNKPPVVPNSECMDCHGAEFEEGADGAPGEWTEGVRGDLFAASVHGKLNCLDCHHTITEADHDPELPPAQCASCHQEAVEEFVGSVHGKIRKEGGDSTANCTTCHGSHDMAPVKHLDSPVSKFNLPQLCGKCHEDEKTAEALGLKKHDAIAHFRDSIHGQSLFKKGLIFAPSCNDCHGVHDIKGAMDADSRVHKAAISETCYACHAGVQKIYEKSVHGELLAKGDPGAPVCTDCHTAHDIERPSNAHFKSTSDQSCGNCHEEHLKGYRDTYHGKAMALGTANVAPEVAACYDCHGHHDVLPHTHPVSTLSKENIVGTCQKCHAGAGESFTQYQPHADPHDGEKFPALNKVYWFMTSLLLSVFAFFGVHTLLWVIRAITEYARDPKAFRSARMAAHLDPETYRRFTSFERFLHILVASSFLVLVITGMPLKFYDTEWAKWMFAVLGGPASARMLHHLAAIVTFLYFGLHLGSLIRNLWRKRGSLNDPETGKFELRRVWKAVFGPDSMVPSFQDFRDFGAHMKWFLGKGPRPQWDRWTYWERFDYFAVFWGVAIIGFSGLVLWFPKFFSLFLPGWFINIAVVIHSDEALLAAGFIFTFHFFNTHFRIDRFPMDMVIFSGHITKTEMLQERRRWYDRLVEKGDLAKHRVIHETWEKRRGYYRVLGFVFLLTGLSLLGLMIYALIMRLGH